MIDADHGRHLAAVGLIFDDIDRLCGCAHRGCSPSLAAHGSQYDLRPPSHSKSCDIPRVADTPGRVARAVRDHRWPRFEPTGRMSSPGDYIGMAGAAVGVRGGSGWYREHAPRASILSVHITRTFIWLERVCARFPAMLCLPPCTRAVRVSNGTCFESMCRSNIENGVL